MRQTVGQGNVGRREGVDDGIADEDWHGGRGGRRTQIDADDVHAEPPAYVIEQCALTAADVEHAARRDWTLTEKAQDFGRVT